MTAGFKYKNLDNQKHQDRRDLLAKKIFHREELHSDFRGESGYGYSVVS